MARQVLLPAALRATLPALYANEGKPAEEAIVHVRFFSIASQGTWWICEAGSGEDSDTLFGYVDLGMTDEPELGYISLSELEGLHFTRARVPCIERDEHFTPKTWGEVKASLQK